MDAAADLGAVGTQWATHLSAPLAERNLTNKLKTEWVNSCLGRSKYYTIPSNVAGENVKIFSVVRLCSGHERRVDTGSREDFRDISVIQFSDMWTREGEAGSERERLTVVASGLPCSVCIWSLCTSFQELREGIRLWQSSPSDTYGAIDLRAPKRVDIDVDLNSDTAPVLLLIEHLRGQGWTLEFVQVTHTREGRTASLCAASARRAYYQVLLRWPELAFEMPSDQVQADYKCILAGIAVPVG